MYVLRDTDPVEIRRTQAERRAETRARLLDATVECLSEFGFAGTTTTAVAKRSGLSRGAQLHHFPTKADLVAAAVEHVFESRLVEFRERLALVPNGQGRVGAAVDLIWEFFEGPTFEAWLELTVAGRTEGELGERISVVTDHLHERITAAWHELFPEAADENPDAPLILFCLFEGMALIRLTGSRFIRERSDALLVMVKAFADVLIPEHAPSPTGATS